MEPVSALPTAAIDADDRHRSFIDIDHFKSVNDRYGHAIGDQAIISVATACQQNKRNSDVVGRLGREEFAILLPETDQAQAAVVAERIRESIAGHVLSAHDVRFKLTISVGIAAATASMSGTDALLRAVDQALYQGKVRRAKPPRLLVAATGAKTGRRVNRRVLPATVKIFLSVSAHCGKFIGTGFTS